MMVFEDQPGRLWWRRATGKAAVEAVRLSLLLDFVLGGYGSAYGITARQRAALILRLERNVRALRAGTTPLSQLIMVREILSIPPEVQGDVVECGSWKGASAAGLSLACHLVGRRLLVCDSFQGLPATGVTPYVAPHHRRYGFLKGGLFAASLDEVKANIAAYGRIDVCHFIPGFFDQSLQQLQDPVVFAFLDVDLPASFRDCLQAIWPLLVEHGAIYADDVGCMELAAVFFDEDWWQQHLGTAAPGLIGSGCGLPISPRYSNIGYTRKQNTYDFSSWQRDPDLYFPKEAEAGSQA